MGEQIRKNSPQRDVSETNHSTEPVAAASSEKLKNDLDDLLDEIDGVLETNAEEFVNSYVQKGGQ